MRVNWAQVRADLRALRAFAAVLFWSSPFGIVTIAWFVMACTLDDAVRGAGRRYFVREAAR